MSVHIVPDQHRIDRVLSRMPRIRSRRRTVYCWAFSRSLAMHHMTMPATRYPRYETRRDAVLAAMRGDDGFPGERLFRVVERGA